jgi:ParB family transcriptional regulator, chromosome partitioning protein
MHNPGSAMALPLDDLDLLSAPHNLLAGTPLQLPVDAIDEDPKQPRSEFDPQALQQLADTIAQRGVRQPISVRPRSDRPERWMLNFGARRLRATKLAGLSVIPAFVDATADSYDQVIENEQREALRPIELALFVQRELHSGQSQAEVARRLGKSRAYITYVCALIDPPDWLMTLYRSGRCRGVKELYDLRRLHDGHAEEVAQWLRSREFVARGDVAALQERLVTPAPEAALPAVAAAASHTAPLASKALHPHGAAASRSSHSGGASAALSPQANGTHRLPSAPSMTLEADCDGHAVRVWLDPLPGIVGQVYVSAAGSASRTTVAIESLRALRLVQR